MIWIPPNPAGGRDLVFGDIHGCFGTVEHTLEALKHDASRDRLFSLGELKGYGPRSNDALAWIRTRFAATVRGNHESMILNSPRTRVIVPAPNIARDIGDSVTADRVSRASVRSQDQTVKRAVISPQAAAFKVRRVPEHPWRLPKVSGRNRVIQSSRSRLPPRHQNDRHPAPQRSVDSGG